MNSKKEEAKAPPFSPAQHTKAMALSSTKSPSILTSSYFSTNPQISKITATATAYYFFPRPTSNNHLDSLNLSSNINSDFDKWRAKVSFFPAFLKKGKDAKVLKEELLDAIAPLDRGAEATPQDQQTVDEIVRKLEAVNPTKEPLKSNLINGKWELIYTTSQSILQTKRPKFLRSKINYQGINVDTLRAQNMESWPFFSQVTADLTPINAKKVAVKFDFFKIGGLIPVKAPETAVGALETTYLDEELRISRGDKGNLFILKMIDPSYRVPV